jgi:hypothetical protein
VYLFSSENVRQLAHRESRPATCANAVRTLLKICVIFKESVDFLMDFVSKYTTAISTKELNKYVKIGKCIPEKQTIK